MKSDRTVKMSIQPESLQDIKVIEDLTINKIEYPANTEIRIVSWNINSDRRAELLDQAPYKYTANAFREFSVNNRFPLIAASIDYFVEVKHLIKQQLA